MAVTDRTYKHSHRIPPVRMRLPEQNYNYYEERLCVSFVLVFLVMESVIYLYMSHAKALLHGHRVSPAAKAGYQLVMSFASWSEEGKKNEKALTLSSWTSSTPSSSLSPALSFPSLVSGDVAGTCRGVTARIMLARHEKQLTSGNECVEELFEFCAYVDQ